jgi:hypothetical protein
VGRELGVDLLVYGNFQFDARFRPDYVREKVLDERTGYFYYRETYKQMVGYQLVLNVTIIDAVSGRRLRQRETTSKTLVEDQTTPDLSGFLRLMEQLYLPLHHEMFPEPHPQTVRLLE